MNDLYKVANAHCSYCGGLFLGESWPRTCLICNNISYKNPIPITITLLPAYRGKNFLNEFGLILIKRNIEPEYGKWALPGGYIDFGETWQQGAVREVKEEIGLDLAPDNIRLYSVENAKNGNILLFNQLNYSLNFDEINFTSNSEVSEIMLCTQPMELGFPIHTKIVEEWIKKEMKFIAATRDYLSNS